MKNQAAFNRLPAGRADLVRALVCCGEDGLECAAASLGFYKIEPVPAQIDRQDNQHSLSGQAFIPSPQGDISPPETPSKNRPIGRFYRMVEYQELDKTEYQRARNAIEQAKPLTEEELNAEPKIQPPKPLPLIPWRRMWPFLRRILGAQRDRRQLDVAKVVKSLSSGQVLTRIPFEQKKYWAPSCQILVEINARNLPFRRDYAELVGKLMQMRGCMGLDIVVVDQGPSSLIYPGLGDQGRYKQPAAGTPVLIISDLGYYDDSGRQTRAWSRFLSALNRGGLRPVALTPTPPRFWPQDLSAWVTPFSWDRGNRLLSPNRPSGSQESATDLNRLLELLAPSVRVEAALLRAIRYLLPKDQLDVASESAAWANPDVMATLNGFQIKPDRKQIYRDAFLRLDDAGLKRRACESLMAYHRHLAPDIVAEEALNCRELAGIEIEESELRSWRVVKTFEPGRHTPVGMVPWFGRLVARQSPDSWSRNPAWEAAWHWWNEEMKQAGMPQAAPDGLNVARAAALALPPQDIIRYRFDQCGKSLLMTPGTSGEASSESEKQKSYLGFIEASTPIISWVLQTADNDADASGVIDLSEANTTGPNLPRGGRLTLSSDIEKCVLDDWLTKPKWASNIGRDHYGLFADFKFKSITQRLRWINPGRFMMGSPPDEPERFDREVQHEVILTQGYWLADTACTQALWLAVMGKNPSHFVGEQRPVESVSYVDIEKFIEQINRQSGGLDLRLPTEAEWEYACRAGTDTPFSFGELLTPEEANYDGNYPYASGEKGEYREHTIDVDALAANPWGLYQIHGNVWEWCADWYDEYPAESAVDPVGPAAGDFRVLRGGSWYSYGPALRVPRQLVRAVYPPRRAFVLPEVQTGKQASKQAPPDRRRGAGVGQVGRCRA